MNNEDDIRSALEDVRANTLRLIADVSEDDFRRQAHPDFSPLGWHLGHIGVTEAYWILQQCKQDPSLSAFYDSFFVPTDNPKPNRVHLPTREDILNYLHTEREQVLPFLVQVNFHSDHSLLREGNIFNMLLQHEEQHNEIMLMILQLIAATHYEQNELSVNLPTLLSPSLPVPLGPQRERTASRRHGGMVRVPGGPFVMGSNDISCTLDNERPQYTVNVAEFLIEPIPVSNSDFLCFIDNGGYRTSHWWTPAGWQWCKENKVEHPLYLSLIHI